MKNVSQKIADDLEVLGSVLTFVASNNGSLENERVSNCFLRKGSNITNNYSTWKEVSSGYENHRQDQCATLGSIKLLTFTGGRLKAVGQWGACKGLQAKAMYPNIRNYGLNNRQLKITTISHPPFAFQDESGMWKGFCLDLMDELSNALNFSYVIIPSPDKRWGADIGNGSYDGMVGQLQREEVDIGMATFFITYGRSKVVDFGYPILHTGYVILTKAPSIRDSQAFVCFGPFSKQVWAALAAATFVAGIFCWVVDRWGIRDKSSCPQRRILSIWTHLWQTMGCIMQQSLAVDPRSTPLRAIVACAWIYAVVVFSTYNGNLIATFTAPQVTTIDTLEQLDKSDIEFGYERSTAIHGVLSSAPSGIYKTLYQKVEPKLDSMLEDSIYSGYKRVLREPNYAFLLWGPYFDTYSVNSRARAIGDKCDFARSRHTFYNNMNAFAMPKGSTLNKLFSLEILRLLEGGIIEHWRQKWYGLAVDGCAWQEGSDYVQMSLTQTQGLFFLLGIGLLLAGMAIAGEVTYSKLVKSKQPKASDPVQTGDSYTLPGYSIKTVHYSRPDESSSNYSAVSSLGDLLQMVHLQFNSK